MNTRLAIDAIPTVADVDRIAALTDHVIRNLQITQCYHELAVVMTQRTGISANWCTFATWASKQAGQTIRKEDLRRLLQGMFFNARTIQARQDIASSAQELGSNRSHTEIQEAVTVVLDPIGAADRASDAVARGNKKVYEEIGREFARFYATCLQDSTYNAGSIAEFCKTLRPGEPPDGQRYLQQAFTHYYRAFFESDAKARAELILLANIEIGYHEQIRLQSEIAEAMNAAFVERRFVKLRLYQRLFPLGGLLAWLRLLFMRLFNRTSPFDQLLQEFIEDTRQQMQLMITRYMLTLELPRGVRLRLGQDVPGEFPLSLKQIVLPELLDLLKVVDPTPDSLAESGTVDWSTLLDRIHYIVDMFRCYQESADLFESPFTAAQIEALKAGRLPEGRL